MDNSIKLEQYFDCVAASEIVDEMRCTLEEQRPLALTSYC